MMLFPEKVWRSKADEYVILKLLINFPVGLLIGVGYYYGAIHRLELKREVDIVVGAGVVTLIMLGFALSKQVRCTALLILPTMFTKEGRFWISTLTYGALLSGPIENVILNSEETLRTTSCSLGFLAKQHSEKVILLSKPLESFSRKVGINMQDFDKDVKSFVNGLTPEAFSISEKIGNVRFGDGMTAEHADYAADWSARNGERDEDEAADERYHQNKKKIDLMKSTMNKDCLEMFASAERKCINAVKAITVDGCLNNRFHTALKVIDTSHLVCKHLSGLYEHCLNRVANQELARQCDPDSAVGPGFEEALTAHDDAMASHGLSEDVSLSIEEITYERKINQTSRSDITQSLKNEFVYKRQILEFITMTMKRLMVFAFVLVVRRAWRYNSKYRTDLMYDNNYVTAYFRKIDERRKLQKIKSLLPLRKFEKKEIVSASSLKLVSEERSKLMKGIVYWVLRVFVGGVIFLVDYVLYHILKVISDNGAMTIKQEVCLPQPTFVPDEITNRIIGLFGMQMALVLFEAYGLRSRRLIAAFFYRKREKKRILFRYNDMLKRRGTYLQRARHQIRRKAMMQKLQQTKSSYLPCLKKTQCLTCEVNLSPKNATRCLNPQCGLSYCKECWIDTKRLCLACTQPDDLDRVLSELTVLSDDDPPAN